jgi:hypothetical protein
MESQVVKFTQYRDPAHRARCGAQAAEQGEHRTGQLLSLAPGGYWIQPSPRRDTDPPVALLGHRSPGELGGFYVLESENVTRPA